jgi:DDE domain
MWCPHCESTVTSERRERTKLGYRRFRCRACKREFNERTGTRFNYLQYPTDVVWLVVLGEKRDKAAAEAFFRSACTVTGSVPECVTTDGYDSYPAAITAERGYVHTIWQSNRFLLFSLLSLLCEDTLKVRHRTRGSWQR